MLRKYPITAMAGKSHEPRGSVKSVHSQDSNSVCTEWVKQVSTMPTRSERDWRAPEVSYFSSYMGQVVFSTQPDITYIYLVWLMFSWSVCSTMYVQLQAMRDCVSCLQYIANYLIINTYVFREIMLRCETPNRIVKYLNFEMCQYIL